MLLKLTVDSLSQSLTALRDYKAWTFTGLSRLRSRFSRTKLGTIWVLIANVISIAILALVYTRIFPTHNPIYFISYISLGYTIWNALTSAVFSALTLTKYHSSSLINTRQNHFFYIFEEVYFQLLNFTIGCMPILLFMFCLQMSSSQFRVSIELFLRLSIGACNLLLFLYNTALSCSLLGLYAPDITQVVPALFQLSFITSPIMFQSSVLGKYSLYAFLNPLYLTLTSLRDPLLWSLENTIPTNFLALYTCSMIFLSIAMTTLFHSHRYKLAYYS